MRKLPITIELPEHFLDAEVRCGYSVSEKMKRIWAVQLDLLAQFDAVCKRHGIKYQMGYGTLLGAVRHKGFIPWDDDIDVWITRAEYENLKSVADDFRHPYFLQTPLSDRRFYVQGARLRNSETTGVICDSASPDYNCGIYLDIYPMDGYLTDGPRLFAQLFAKHILTKCIERYRNWPWVRFLSYETLNKWCDRVTSHYTGRIDRWSLVAGMVWSNRRRYWMLGKELEESVDLPFEHLSFPGSRHYEQVLTRIYGDYMALPPEDSRGRYHEEYVTFDPDKSYRDYFNERR